MKGRFRYHYLLGGIFSRNGHADAERLEFFWKQVSHGARVEVRQYDLAFDEAADMRWRKSRPTEADNIDVGELTDADLQGDLLEVSDEPF